MAVVAASAMAGLAAPPVATAQAVTAPSTVFSATGSNGNSLQTISVTLHAAAVLRAITVPVGFETRPDFIFVSQTGCIVDGATVNPSGSVCSVQVSFRPYGAGVRRGALAVTDGSGNTYAFPLTGIGPVPQLAFTPGAARLLAGSGNAGYTGDGGISILATLSAPTGVATDTFGNTYVADTGNNRVRMLDAFGNITTIAGGGTAAGSAADGGPATAALLNRPAWLALDGAGNLYIAETGANAIRRVALLGDHTITTVNTGSLNAPRGLALNAAGDLFLADSGNNRIQRVDGTTGAISTVAGTGTAGFNAGSTAAGSAQFNAPAGLALDAAGNLYIADAGNHAVRKLAGGLVTVVAGTGTAGHTGDGGAATSATLMTPTGIAVDAAGDLYIADSGAATVRIVEAASGVISVVLGDAQTSGNTLGVTPATITRIGSPAGIALDAAQNLLVVDAGNHEVRRLATAPGDLQLPVQGAGTASAPYPVRVRNIGSVPLHVSGESAANSTTSSNFTLASPCTSAIAPGDHCDFTVIFNPQASGFIPGEIDVTSDSLVPQYQSGSGTLPIYLLGGTETALTLGPPTLPNPVQGVAYDQTITAAGGFGPLTLQTGGALPPGLTATINGNTIHLTGTPTTNGTYTLAAYATDALGASVALPYTLTTAPPILTLPIMESITVSDSVVPLSGLQLPIAESITVTDDVKSLSGLQLPIMENVQVTDNVQAVPGAQAQTITAPTFAGHIYGDSAFTVTATASSGLPVTVAVSGPATYSGSTLDLTGAGTVTVTFTQAGNASYQAAPTVTRTFSVAPAMLTVAGGTIARAFQTNNPPLPYTITGLVHGDTAATLGGIPALTTPAVLNSPAGSYSINVAQGTLASANYAFTFTPGTLTVTGQAAQTITFNPLPNIPFSYGGITLSARSTSGLAITYTVSGPATVSRNKLTFTGQGVVTVVAAQAGNATYTPASSVTRSFTVTP